MRILRNGSAARRPVRVSHRILSARVRPEWRIRASRSMPSLRVSPQGRRGFGFDFFDRTFTVRVRDKPKARNVKMHGRRWRVRVVEKF